MLAWFLLAWNEVEGCEPKASPLTEWHSVSVGTILAWVGLLNGIQRLKENYKMRAKNFGVPWVSDNAYIKHFSTNTLENFFGGEFYIPPELTSHFS